MMLAPLCPDCIIICRHLVLRGQETMLATTVMFLESRSMTGAVVHAGVGGLVDDDALHGEAEALA